jgi:hypothetical protein
MGVTKKRFDFLPWLGVWRKRLFAVALVVAFVLFLSPYGTEVGATLRFAAFVGASVLASTAPALFAMNVILATVWLAWPVRFAMTKPYLVVVTLNRWAGHAEALLGWLTLAFVLTPRVLVQIPMAAAVVFFGAPIIDKITLARARSIVDEGDLLWARRPTVYIATALSLVFLMMLAPSQVLTMLPLITAVVAGLVLRLLATLHHRPHARHEVHRHVRVEMARIARRIDPVFAAVVVIAAGMVPLIVRFVHDAERKASRELKSREAKCEDNDDKAPSHSDVSLFLVADSQFHVLGGERTAAHLELADSIVPVAVRPIELDLLSEATLLHFASIYREMHVPDRENMTWAHLGDFGDLGCRGELDRLGPVFDAFRAVDELAGIAPGNHDSAFVGNFAWEPEWDGSCGKSGRAEKHDSDAALFALATNRMSAQSLVEARPVPGNPLVAPHGFMATATPLGVTTNATGRHGVIALFVDTSDRGPGQLGISGVFGSVSKDQVRQLSTMARALRERDAEYRDPYYVILMHHPTNELDATAKRAFATLFDEFGARTLAIVSAHTHLSARKHWRKVAERTVPEYILGSTIDPPQEAAVLDIGPNAANGTAVRLETIQAVSREIMTCSDHGYTAAECDESMRDLAAECPDLFARDAASRIAPEVYERVGIGTSLRAWFSKTDRPVTPEQVKALQLRRGNALLACLCKRSGCTPPANALDDAAVFPFIRRMFATRPRDLVCLSWAASIVQEYKHTAGGPHSLAEAQDRIRKHSDDGGEIVGAKRWVDGPR